MLATRVAHILLQMTTTIGMLFVTQYVPLYSQDKTRSLRETGG